MAQEKASQPPSSAPAEDTIPIKKTSSTAYIVGGAGVIVVLGLVFGLSGGDDDAKAKAESTEKAADKAQGMTKAELEERQEHIKRTQAALIAAAAEEEEEAKEKKAAEEKKQAEEAEATAAASPQPSGGSAKKPADKKKTMDSLDGLGTDITSALK
jgi:hypothetical protein